MIFLITYRTLYPCSDFTKQLCERELINVNRGQFKGRGGGSGTTRPLPRDGGAEELRVDPTVWPHPKVWTID